MQAVQVTSHQGPEAVTVADVPEPTAGDGKVLVDVHAAGVSYPDVLLSRGLYQMKPDLPFTPGAEVAGVVRQAPAGSPLQAGDRVVAFPGLGGMAETVAVDPAQVFPLPDRLSMEEGAGIPMNLLTVHFALDHRGHLAPGESVLVHGAAGGVGTAAIQLAHARGNRVIAVASTPEKMAFARGAGADEAIPVEGFKDAVAELTGGRGVDIVVDPVGGDRFTDSLRSLAVDGRLLVIGFTGGEIPTVRVNRLLLNNIAVVGVGWGAYWMSRPSFLAEQWADLLPLLSSGDLAPAISGTYPLAEASRALSLMDQRGVLGKVIVTLR